MASKAFFINTLVLSNLDLSLPDVFEMTEERVLTVAQFNRFVKSLVSKYRVNVQGEITEVRTNRWVSLTIKDSKENASVGVFGLKAKIRNFKELEVGSLVKVTGKPWITVKEGRFGIFADEIIPFGEGELLAAYEKLKAKLEKEGLFIRKRPIMPLPERLCLLTAEGSDAYHDFLTNLRGRRSDVEVVFNPINVQGVQAIPTITSAFEWINESVAEGLSLDLVVLTRGGGSMEDLYAFNTEEAARAVFGSKVPVISAIGHERHTPLTDLVADKRASNPQDAAELASPLTSAEVLGTIERDIASMETKLRIFIERRQSEIGHSVGCLERYFQERSAHLESLKRDLERGLSDFEGEVLEKSEDISGYVEDIDESLKGVIKSRLEFIAAKEGVLRSNDPKLKLKMGYSITRSRKGKILRSAEDVGKGEELHTELHEGKIISEVK